MLCRLLFLFSSLHRHSRRRRCLLRLQRGVVLVVRRRGNLDVHRRHRQELQMKTPLFEDQNCNAFEGLYVQPMELHSATSGFTLLSCQAYWVFLLRVNCDEM